MLEQPEQLTTAEMLKVNAYLDAAKFLILGNVTWSSEGSSKSVQFLLMNTVRTFSATATLNAGGASSHQEI